MLHLPSRVTQDRWHIHKINSFDGECFLTSVERFLIMLVMVGTSRASGGGKGVYFSPFQGRGAGNKLVFLRAKCEEILYPSLAKNFHISNSFLIVCLPRDKDVLPPPKFPGGGGRPPFPPLSRAVSYTLLPFYAKNYFFVFRPHPFGLPCHNILVFWQLLLFKR